MKTPLTFTFVKKKRTYIVGLLLILNALSTTVILYLAVGSNLCPPYCAHIIFNCGISIQQNKPNKAPVNLVFWLYFANIFFVLP